MSGSGAKSRRRACGNGMGRTQASETTHKSGDRVIEKRQESRQVTAKDSAQLWPRRTWHYIFVGNRAEGNTIGQPVVNQQY